MGQLCLVEKSFCLPMAPRYTKTLGKNSACAPFVHFMAIWRGGAAIVVIEITCPKPSDCNELHEDHVIHDINMANTYRLA